MPAIPTSTVVVLLVFLVFSAFFSASETALTSLSKIRLRGMVDEGVKGAREVEKATKRMDRLLSSILVGNNFVNIGLSSLATSLTIRLTDGSAASVGIATVVVTLVILVFGEITPKTFASRSPEAISVWVIKPIRFIQLLLTPIVVILNGLTAVVVRLVGKKKAKSDTMVTESELKTMVNVSHEEGIIEVDERKMIHNIFDFKDSHAKDVMTPRMDIVGVSMKTTRDEIMNLFRSEQVTRIPVYEDSLDNIVGILHFKDFIFSESPENEFSLQSCIRKPFFSYEYKSTSELFEEMRTMNSPLAVILDEYGGTAGIVTLEDLVEEIVGDILDEYDEENEKYTVDGQEFVVEGSMKVSEFNELAGSEIVTEDYDSMAGYLLELLGNIPEVQDSVSDDNFVFTVLEMDKNRIEKIKAVIK